jgi:hypothetical protein
MGFWKAIGNELKKSAEIAGSSMIKGVPTKSSQMGSHVPEAGTKAGGSWRTPPAKQEELPKKIDTSAWGITGKDKFTREEASRYILKELGPTGSLKDLRNKYYKYFGKYPTMSNTTSEERKKIVEDIFGSEKEGIGSIIDKKSDATPFFSRDRKLRESIASEGDVFQKEKEKLIYEIYNTFNKGKKS